MDSMFGTNASPPNSDPKELDHDMNSIDDDDDDYVAQAMREREEPEPAPIQFSMPIRLRVPDAPDSAKNIQSLLDSGVLFRATNHQDSPHVALTERAKGTHGQPFATECFGPELRHHAHHHRLRCGHDVMTKEIETCGQNCKPSESGAGVKPFEDPFACTAKECKPKVNIFLEKARRKKRTIRKRACRLSQVQGAGAQAHEKRVQELEKLKAPVERKEAKSGIPNSDDQLPQAIRMTRQNAANVDHAEEMNAFIDVDPSWKSVLNFKGPGCMVNSNGRFKTRKEWEEEFGSTKVSKALFGLRIESQGFLGAEANQQTDKTPQFDDREAHNDSTAQGDNSDTDEFLDAECDCCDRKIFRFRFTCQVCPNIDFCSECYLLRRDTHDMKHEFLVFSDPVQYREIATETGAENFREEAQASSENKRETRASKARASLQNQGGEMAAHVTNGRKQKARIEKQKRYYKPELRVQKREELKAATTEAQRKAIHNKFRVVLDEQNDEDESGELSDGEEMAAVSGTSTKDSGASRADGDSAVGTRRSERLKKLYEELFGENVE